MKGILLSLGILIPTILPSQTRLVPFLGDLFSILFGKTSWERLQASFRPLSRELFSISLRDRGPWLLRGGFHPLSRGLFFNYSLPHESGERDNVFVPFLGDFFSIITINVTIDQETKNLSSPFSGTFFNQACLRSPSPSALSSAFAAGMGGSLHQALSFGDEMPIFSGRAGIGGDLQ